MGRSNYSTSGLLNAVTKRAFNRYQAVTVDYQHLEAATTTSGLVSNRREYSSAHILGENFSLNALNLAQANYDPFLKLVLSTDFQDTLKELSGEGSGFNTGLDISLSSDGTKLAVIHRDGETLGDGNTEIRVYDYDSARYGLVTPVNIATHDYQGVTIASIDSSDDGQQLFVLLSDQSFQKFALSETNVLTSDTAFSFGPLGGTGDITMNVSHDGSRVSVFRSGVASRVYEYANPQGGYYTSSALGEGLMSKNGRRVITKTGNGIETFELPEQAPNGPVVLQRLPGYLPTALTALTPVALSFDGNMMLGVDTSLQKINLYVWAGVEWKQHVTILNGNSSVADMSRDGTYIVAGTPIRTFKWDSASSNYSEYGGTTLQTINDATSVSINQNGDELVIGRNSVSQIFILTNGVWSRRATVSGTSGEGKSVRVANDGKVFTTASDTKVTFHGDAAIVQYPFAWKQRGNTVSIPSYVRSIALSDNGNFLVAGLYKEDISTINGPESEAGSVRVFNFNGATWSQFGADIEHDTANTLFGHSVAISPDSSKIAVGGNGLVRVFTNEVKPTVFNIKNTISSIPLTPFSGLFEISGDSQRMLAHTQNDYLTPRLEIFDGGISTNSFVDGGSAIHLSNNGSYLAVERDNVARVYGINSQAVVSLIGTSISPSDSSDYAGAFRLTTANANAKININTADTGLINLATSYGSTTEICSLMYDPTTETTTRTTTNQIVTDDSSEINGFASHHGIAMSRDAGTLVVYDNTKFNVYSFANSTWTFVRTKTVSPYIVVLSHDGTRVAYLDGSLNIENTITGASLGTISVSSLHTYAFKDNTTLALLQGTNDIELYNYDGTSWTLDETLTYSGSNASSRLRFSGDGDRLAAGDSYNRSVTFFDYDATLNPPVFSFIQDGNAHSASVLELSGNGDVKVVGTSTDVEIIEASGTTTFTGAPTSVGVSSNGTRVVVGTSTKMYVVEKSGGVWAQLGSDIAGNAPEVAISPDGSKIFSNDGALLKSYELVSGSWTTYLPNVTTSYVSKISSSTDGNIVAVRPNVYSKQTITTNAGYSFSLSTTYSSTTTEAVSGNGNVRAVANKNANSSTGEVVIYEKVNGAWSTTASATFTGASATEEFGRDVDISKDGTRVVMGSATKMVVVEKSGGTWSQLGSDISGSSTYVGISRDGSKVFNYDGSSLKSYELVSGSWTQYLPDLTSLANISAVQASNDGDIVALSKIGSSQVYSKQNVTVGGGYSISEAASLSEPNGSRISENGSVVVTYSNKIFEKDSNGNWPSTPSATFTGTSIAIGVSDDGTRVAMQSASAITVVEKPSSATTTYTVTVASVGGGDRYHIDGVDRPQLTFYRGNTYVFDLSDASNTGHPLGFVTASAYTDGVVNNYSTNPPGSAGSQVTWTVPATAPSPIWYYCEVHGTGMGTNNTVTDRVWSQIGSNITGNFIAVTGSCMTGDGTKVFGTSAAQSGGTTFTQVGSDIDGEAAGDESGYSVSMSSDGTRVAIGAPRNDGAGGTESGQVRVYAESGGTWTQVGADIDGLDSYTETGWEVSLSGDGKRVAISAPYYMNTVTYLFTGRVRVFEESGGTWTQMGADILGEADSDEPRAVSMNSDGTRVAIGAIYNDGNGNAAGHVRVFAESGGTWTQVGTDIDGEAAGDWSGRSVSMSSDGTRVAIGAPYNNNYTGHVRVYAESSGTWTQVGTDIDGEAAYDRSWSVSISGDGTRVAIGAPYNDGTGSNAGHVRVYEESGGTWTQVGTDIDSEAAADNFGYSVSLSSDGNKLAIGALYNDGTGSNAGHVRVYEESGGTWTQVGADIDGEAADDLSGRSVSMSSDGTRVAIGAPWNDGNGAKAGHVRVYSLPIPIPGATSSWEYSGSSWSQYRPDITSSLNVTRISHSTNGEIVGLEDANKVIIYATTSSGSSYSKRHADASYSTSYHSLSDDGSQLISRGYDGSRSWNGTNYVYDGAGATQTIWGPSTNHFIEVSGNGNLVFHVDLSANTLKLYSKSISNGNVSWSLETDLAFTYYPVLASGLASDAIVVTGSGSAGAKIYDVTYTPGSTTAQYATRGTSFSGYQIGMSDDGSKIVSTSYQKTSTAWNGTDYVYDGSNNATIGAPWLYFSGGNMSFWLPFETNRRVYLSGDGNRALLVASHAFGMFTDIYVQMFYRITNSADWSSTDVDYLTYNGTWGNPSIDTDGDFFGIKAGRFYDILYDPGTTSDQYAIRGTGLGSGSNHALSEDGNVVVYRDIAPGIKTWNGSSWSYSLPDAPWTFGHTLLALSGDATKAIAFKSSTNEVIFYTKDAQQQWSQNVTLAAQAGVTALSIDTDGSIVGVAANGQTKFYTFGSTQSPIGWVSHSSIQDMSLPNFAQSFDISNDGDAVVVGAPGDGTSSYRGEVRVYDYASSSWTPRTTITPPSETVVIGNVGFRSLGKSVSISASGDRISYLGDQGDYVGSESTSTSTINITSNYQTEITNNGGTWGTIDFFTSYVRLTAAHLYSENNGIWFPVTFGSVWSVSFDWILYSGADDMRFIFYAPNQPTSYAGSQHGGYNIFHEFYGSDQHAIRDPSDSSLSTVSTTYTTGSWSLVSISYDNGVLTTNVAGASGTSRSYTFTGTHLSAQQALWGTNTYIAISGRTGGVAVTQYLRNINISWETTTQTVTLTPNRSEASTRDWENSAWVNPAYATDEVTSTEIVPATENRDLATIAMSYDGTRFGVKAESGSYDAIVKKLDTLVITTTHTFGWTKRGEIMSFSTTDSVAASSSRSMASSADGNTVAFAYVNSSGVKIRIYGYASGAWSQLGSEISTTGATVSIDLSDNGSTLAVLSSDTGRVYVYNGIVWSQLGSSITFRPTGVDTIKISGNGNYVALGNNTPSDPYPYNILEVYKLENADWQLISPTMTLSKTPTNYFGSGFGLTNDGSRLVHLTDSGVEFASFATDTRGTFSQHSGDIIGNGVGYALAFDNSGSTLVVGSFSDNVVRVYDSGLNIVTTFNVNPQPSSAKKPFAITKDGSKLITIAPPSAGLNVVVYKKENGTWSQEGNAIGIATTDRISAVDITNDGNTVLVGSTHEAQSGAPGRAQVFALSNGAWSQVGTTITNPEGNHRFSNVVSISDIGTIVCAGHYTYNSGNPIGIVKTYETRDEIQDISFGPPIIELIGNSYVKLALNTVYEELGANIRTEASIVPELKITGEVNIGLPGVYTIRYEAEDTLRKKAVPVFRTVEIVSAIPSFGIKGEPLIYHTKGTVYTDQGVEVFSGYEDGTDFKMYYIEPNAPLSPIPSGSGFTPTLEGDYTIIWVDQIVDEQLRSGPTRTRTVRVRERPVITLNGNTTIYHRLFDPYIEPGVTITQSTYGFEGTTTTTPVNPRIPGILTVTYTAVDRFGIEAIPITRTLDIKARPVINVGDTLFYHTLNDQVTLPPVTVFTPVGYSYDLTPFLQSSNNINKDVKGDYKIEHTLTDATGISAEPKSQDFKVGSHGSLTFSKTGSVFAYSGSSVVVYDTAIKTYNIQVDGTWNLYSTLSVPSTPTALKMTKDGQYLVVGMSSHLTIGIVQVYSRNALFAAGWEQVGFDIFGTDYLGGFGDAVDINSSGTRVVVGAPQVTKTIFKAGSVKVFDWSGFFWNQTQLFDGTLPNEFLGQSVSLDSVGATLAVGSPGHTVTTISGSNVTTVNVGKTAVYKLVDSVWSLLGSEIEDGPANKRNGTSVSLSSDGKNLVVGSVLGGARVYNLTENNTWVLKGSQLLPNVGGKSVSINEEGDSIAVGSEEEYGNGRVYIFNYRDGGWSNATQSFDKVVTGSDASLLGKHVVLNNSGTSLCLLTDTEVRIYRV